jgi:pyruvate formate lyase activating enzyme
MTDGIVFDIREFALHDGPGIRTTVFLKGCPLACQWCHNPESQSPRPQKICSQAGERTAGTVYSSTELAKILNRQAAILKRAEGGVTFSGGEPLMQAEFVAEIIDQLDGLQVVLDTSGYGSPTAFRKLLSKADLVYYDLKLIDDADHRRYTGKSNRAILRNLQTLAASRVPFVARVPLVPGVTDTEENLAAVAQTVACMPGLVRVDLLPYNRSAGAKYAAAGMTFHPEYDEERPLNTNTKIFEAMGIPVIVQ